MFAVALWTESKKRLVLARDRMGIKPLYIARRGDDLFFGSELKAIFVHPEIERNLSLAGLDCYLSLNYVPCPWTLVEGIEKLPPGQLAGMARRQGSAPRRTGRCQRRRASIVDSGIGTGRARFAAAAVRPRTSGFRRAAGRLAERRHRFFHDPALRREGVAVRLKTFSISFRGRSFDETQYIREVAAHYGTDHEQFDLNPEVDLAGAIEEFAYYSDEPNADAGALPVWFLSKLSKTKRNRRAERRRRG